MYSRSYSFPTAGGFFDPVALSYPGTNIFDSPVIFGSAGVDLTYAKSARWSFNMGGNVYSTRYRNTALFGATSLGARGDAVYRYSRNGSIGVAYEFQHTEFKHSFGAFDYHAVTLVYSLRLSKLWDLQLKAGGGRIESLSLQQITIDPVIAAITGQTSGIAAAYRLNYVPELGGMLTRKMRNAGLTFSYDRSVSAGNGLYLASASESASITYNYTGVRRWSFSGVGSYSRLTAVLQSIGSYKTYWASGRVSRAMGKGLQLTSEIGLRRYDVGVTAFQRNSYEAMLGFSWSPGNLPLAFW
jgi:hypothetical protein